VFSHFLDPLVLNSFILLMSYGSELSYWYFRLAFVRALIQGWGGQGRVPQPHNTPWGRKTNPFHQPTSLTLRKTHHIKHWPPEGKWIHCCICSTKNQEMWTKFKCSKCNMGLCVDSSYRGVKMVKFVLHFVLYVCNVKSCILSAMRTIMPCTQEQAAEFQDVWPYCNN
jgi:hypothetical protein